MKKRFLLAVLLIICIGIGIGIASPYLGVDQFFRSTPVMANDSEESSDQLPDEMALTTNMLKDLSNKALESLPSDWVHVHYIIMYDTDQPNNGVLPNGEAISNHQINDWWIHLEDGFIMESVFISRNIDGRIIQVGVSGDGTAWNNATQEIFPQDPLELESLDRNFLRDVLRQTENGDDISLEVKNVILPTGELGYMFTLVEQYTAPIKSVDFTKPSIKMTTKATFDAATGFLSHKQQIVFFADGSQRIFMDYTQTVQVEEPTTEVKKYLEEKSKVVNP